jgi:hypothetical protein
VGFDLGILWIILAFLVVGVFYVFWVAGEKLTPKNSPITGKPRTPEEMNKKSFNKAIVLIFVAIFVFILITG